MKDREEDGGLSSPTLGPTYPLKNPQPGHPLVHSGSEDGMYLWGPSWTLSRSGQGGSREPGPTPPSP